MANVSPILAPPLSEEPILSARGLDLGYGGLPVLVDVNVEVRRGEFWFVVGPNGHGKTTLLWTLIGRLAPQRGQVVTRGDFAQPERIGFVPQQCSLNPTLPTTVREFVLLGLVGIRCGRRERCERLAWALDKVGLVGLEAADYWSLSVGQRQRALVARALVRRPRVLLADEPTAALDLSVEASLLNSLAELNRQERLTLILVMHDLATAARYATHAVLVHNGRLQAGEVTEILSPENLQRAYGVPVEVLREPAGTVSVRLGGRKPT